MHHRKETGNPVCSGEPVFLDVYGSHIYVAAEDREAVCQVSSSQAVRLGRLPESSPTAARRPKALQLTCHSAIQLGYGRVLASTVGDSAAGGGLGHAADRQTR